MLTVVPTPIGNLDDITVRALDTLRGADLVACEDTRHTRRLLERYEIRDRKLVTYFEGNEDRAIPRILAEIDAGRSVALVSNAGTPVLSDPGFRLLEAVREAGGAVTVLPGPTAVVPALVASGLAPARFTFLGFPARKPGRLRNELAREAESPHTLVYYESPRRLGRFLEAAAETLGDRPAAVCRELSKIHEEVIRGRLPELARRFSETPAKGEIVVVIAGAENRPGGRTRRAARPDGSRAAPPVPRAGEEESQP